MEEQNLGFYVEEDGERLDRYLASRLPDRSRAEIQRWIQRGAVLLNQKPAKPGARLTVGSEISITIPVRELSSIAAQPIDLEILYEDTDILAVNKPAGMVVHPAPGHESGTLVNAILYHCPALEGVGEEQRPGIVHRLDKDTSGIILVAKNDRAHRQLQSQFKARTVRKTYLALISGRIEPASGRIIAPIGRHATQRKQMAIQPLSRGREAETLYTTIANFNRYTLVAAYPLSGRTHQIRVHFASLAHPVAGDALYGSRRDPLQLGRHFLHAHRLQFLRPGDGKELPLEAPLAPELRQTIDQLAPGGRFEFSVPDYPLVA